MVDKEILTELRQIVENNGEAQITQKSLNKLMLAAVTETLSKIGDLGTKMETMLDRQDEMKHNSECWQENIDAVRAQVGSINERLLQVEKSFIVKVGDFISKNPKTTFVIFAIAVTVVSLWDLRGLVLHLLGLPSGIIVIPTVTPTLFP